MGKRISFEFSEDKRHRLAKLLGFAHWACILPSFLCLILALVIQVSIENKISFIEDYNGAALPGFLVFTGFYGFIAHVLCGKVTYTCRQVDKRDKWSPYLRPVVFATLAIFLAEFIAGIMCFAHIGSLEDGFNTGIMKGLAAYKDDATTKEQIDVLQMTYSCCGSRSYRDWFTVSWVHPDFEDEIKGKNNVPFSCCNPGVMRPCIRNSVHDNSAHYKYDYEKQTTLHTEGCTEILMDYFSGSILTVAGALVLSLSFIQVGTSVAGRLLETSIATSMGNDDPEEPSVAYLFLPPKDLADRSTTLTETTADDTTLDTTVTTVEAGEEPIYDVVDDEAALYENVNQSLNNEDEVEYYLATKYATSRERFESPEFEDEFYDQEPLGPSLTKVLSNTGNYMSMDKSNSSRIQLNHGRNRSSFSDFRTPYAYVHKHPFPSPESGGARQKDPLIIDMAHHFSPERPKRPRHSSPIPYKSPRRHRHSRRRREESASPERQRLLPRKWQVRPVIGGISVGADNRKNSPTKRRRSPQHRVSPVKTSFRSGISYGCNHALE